MSLSMHTVGMPTFLNTLGALSKILDKAAAHCEAKKIDPATLLTMRLSPDMFTFTKQVQLTCDFAKNTVGRLTGEPPKFLDDEKTFADLKARIAKTIDYVKSFKSEQIDATAEKDVTFPIGPQQTMTLKGAQYRLGFALPNFYFHATTAYDILRHCRCRARQARFSRADLNESVIPKKWRPVFGTRSRSSELRRRGEIKPSGRCERLHVEGPHLDLAIDIERHDQAIVRDRALDDFRAARQRQRDLAWNRGCGQLVDPLLYGAFAFKHAIADKAEHRADRDHGNGHRDQHQTAYLGNHAGCIGFCRGSLRRKRWRSDVRIRFFARLVVRRAQGRQRLEQRFLKLIEVLVGLIAGEHAWMLAVVVFGVRDRRIAIDLLGGREQLGFEFGERLVGIDPCLLGARLRSRLGGGRGRTDRHGLAWGRRRSGGLRGSGLWSGGWRRFRFRRDRP